MRRPALFIATVATLLALGSGVALAHHDGTLHCKDSQDASGCTIVGIEGEAA
ncbi:MAG TPA: hypothetical protein VK869_10965 [Rubrobacteraceae bacterium]|nr:hypothetical protein [Rubrobacteraceae bacterium]